MNTSRAIFLSLLILYYLICHYPIYAQSSELYSPSYGPALIESAPGQIKTGFYTMHPPTGYFFDTQTAFPKLIVAGDGYYGNNLNLTFNNNTITIDQVTDTSLTFQIRYPSKTPNTLYFQNLYLKPSITNPLAGSIFFDYPALYSGASLSFAFINSSSPSTPPPSPSDSPLPSIFPSPLPSPTSTPSPSSEITGDTTPIPNPSISPIPTPLPTQTPAASPTLLASENEEIVPSAPPAASFSSSNFDISSPIIIDYSNQSPSSAQNSQIAKSPSSENPAHSNYTNTAVTTGLNNSDSPVYSIPSQDSSYKTTNSSSTKKPTTNALEQVLGSKIEARNDQNYVIRPFYKNLLLSFWEHIKIYSTKLLANTNYKVLAQTLKNYTHI